MQVDTPHHPPMNFRSFLQQYAMIVLSILTALALEQAVVWLHNASAARGSRVRIEAEIGSFVSDLKHAAQTNADRLKSLSEVLAALDTKLKDGTLDDTTLKTLAQKAVEHFGITFPSVERDSWDAAIADQTVSHLAASDLRRYAEIYADEMSDLEETRIILSGSYITRISDTEFAVRVGKINAQSLAETLTLDTLSVQDILRHQQTLIQLIETGKHPPDAKG